MQVKSVPTVHPILPAVSRPQFFSGKSEILRTCAPCGAKEKLYRQANDNSNFFAPASVQNFIHALPGSGSPLPATTNQFFRSRMQHDFSDVKVHTGTAASINAKAINAKAFTYKNNIVFNESEYNPDSEKGKKLLAHELTHVMQQDGSSIKRQALPAPLPSVSQGPSDTCAAASLVTALVIWDNEHLSATTPNSRFVAATNIVLSHYAQHQTTVTRGIETRLNISSSDAATFYMSTLSRLRGLIGTVRTPGHVIADSEYQLLVRAIYVLYVDGSSGLSEIDVGNIQRMLGVDGNRASRGNASFSQLMGDSILVGLRPGQAVQVGWYVGADPTHLGPHIFLMGRLSNNDWFLHDQGYSPPTRLQAPRLGDLVTLITIEAAAHRSWIFTGTPVGPPSNAWLGVRLLGGENAVITTSMALITLGTYLAEVDGGYLTCGDRINSDAFISEHYVFADAQNAARSVSGSGAVIVEMPAGRFVVFQTGQVRNPNRYVSAIDTSGGGILAARRRFVNVWLQLRSPAGLGSFITIPR